VVEHLQQAQCPEFKSQYCWGEDLKVEEVQGTTEGRREKREKRAEEG
jgi:hypothetical protein